MNEKRDEGEEEDNYDKLLDYHGENCNQSSKVKGIIDLIKRDNNSRYVIQGADHNPTFSKSKTI
jgi:hypothetical protein